MVAPIVPRLARLASEKSWHSFNALWSERVWWMGWLSGGVVLVLFLGAFAVHRLDLLDQLSRDGTLQAGDLTRMWVILMSCSGAVSYTHLDVYKRQGKDVFVEKPLCLTLEGGRELVALAAAQGRVLMVGHLLWYHPAVLTLRQLIAQGELGRIQYLSLIHI